MTIDSRIPNPDWVPLSRFDKPDDIADLEPGRFEVHCRGMDFGCEIEFMPGADRLLVALNPGQSAPYPSFLALPPRAMCHVLRLSDPSVLLTPATFSCFIGTEDQDPVAALLEITERVAATLGMPPGRIVFYGISGGGFGALMCAARSGAAAVVVNSQLDLGEPHFSRLGAQLFDAFRPGCTGTGLKRLFPERFAVAEALAAARKAGRSPRMIICQNTGDEAHFDWQFAPFCEQLGIPPTGGFDAAGDIECYPFERPGGHGAFWPQRDVIADALMRFAPMPPYRQQDSALSATGTYEPGPDRTLHLEADGERLVAPEYEAGWHRWTLPGPARTIRLRSPTFSPADDNPATTDDRTLGVAVTGLRITQGDTVRVVNLAGGLLGAGWHSEEEGAGYPWRWTNGSGVLHLPEGTSAVAVATTFRRPAAARAEAGTEARASAG